MFSPLVWLIFSILVLILERKTFFSKFEREPFGITIAKESAIVRDKNVNYSYIKNHDGFMLIDLFCLFKLIREEILEFISLATYA